MRLHFFCFYFWVNNYIIAKIILIGEFRTNLQKKSELLTYAIVCCGLAFLSPNSLNHL